MYQPESLADLITAQGYTVDIFSFIRLGHNSRKLTKKAFATMIAIQIKNLWFSLKIVELEEMPVLDQIKLFQRHSIVVGTSGTGVHSILPLPR